MRNPVSHVSSGKSLKAQKSMKEDLGQQGPLRLMITLLSKYRDTIHFTVIMSVFSCHYFQICKTKDHIEPWPDAVRYICESSVRYAEYCIDCRKFYYYELVLCCFSEVTNNYLSLSALYPTVTISNSIYLTNYISP